MARRKIHKTCYNQCIVPSAQPNHSKQYQACSQGRAGWKEAQPFERNARTKWIDLGFKKFHWKKWSFITPRPQGRALQIAQGRERVDGVWGAKTYILWLPLHVLAPDVQFLFDIFNTCAVPSPWRRVALREWQHAQALQVSPSPSRLRLCRSCGRI